MKITKRKAKGVLADMIANMDEDSLARTREKMIDMEELILCKCENTEHQMIIRTLDCDDDVYVTIHLRPLPLRERLVHGLKYIFGHRSRYGDFDEMILRPEDADKFGKVLKWLKTNHNPIKP